MSWRDRWWFLNYRWHRWRLERNYHLACAHHAVLTDHLGVERIVIKRTSELTFRKKGSV